MATRRKPPTGKKRPTHAGGVVYRMRGGNPEFLVVTARRRPLEWVLPKGHIDAGEPPKEAAVREVEEETGVVARIERLLDDVVLDVGHERQRIRFYLMKAIEERESRERRKTKWLEAQSAMKHVTFQESRDLLQAALDVLTLRKNGEP